jgi:thymidylate synthase
MEQYHSLLKHVMENGSDRMDRTGVGVRSVFGYQMRFDLTKGFPLVTTKRMFWKGLVEEFLWMVVKGSTNINDLPENVQHWWSPWADQNGDLGPIYGERFRRVVSVKEISSEFKYLDRSKKYSVKIFDPIKETIANIIHDPFSRRHVISMWDHSLLEDMKLPPCHGTVIQFYISTCNKLSCHVYVRSNDLLLGCPVNIGFYSLLTHIVAQLTNKTVGDLIYSIGDAHIYHNHFDQVNEQLSREPYELPQLWLNPNIRDIDSFKYEDIKLINYKSHPPIKAPIAV